MKITDALLGEHAMLYALFTDIRRQIGEDRSIERLHVAVEMLENQLWTHAQMEENHLFPALEPHLGQMGPLRVMKSEHQEIDRLLVAAKTEANPEQLKLLVDELIMLAYNHFRKEEMVLFGMTRQVLSEDEQENLGNIWASEREVIVNGAGCPSQAAG